MERKIGEIFEFNGEWYQCAVNDTHLCDGCNFYRKGCTLSKKGKRKIKCGDFIFKKLEKVGDCYYDNDGNLFQDYKIQYLPIIIPDNPDIHLNMIENLIEIQIKQTKEDMEEEKHSNLENTGKNLKPFDLQKAREGKPVCTRDGRKARIICFDYAGETGDYPIVALVSYDKGNNCYERVLKYTSDGLFNKYGDYKHDDDLMMLPEKKEGWINVKKDASLFKSREEAERNCTKDYAPVRVEFEI